MVESERAQLEMKISRYRQIARASDPTTAERVSALVAELELELRNTTEHDAGLAVHRIRLGRFSDASEL